MPSKPPKNTLVKLLTAERSQKPNPSRPSQVPLGLLKLAEDVFQWRKFTSELSSEETHIKELVRILRTAIQPLDPILVKVIGDKFYIVDGHHRYYAYKKVNWSSLIPVNYFEGTVEEARLEGLKCNIKNKLPMTKEDKFESAWTLVKDGKLTKKEIEELTTVSVRTVGNMRKVLKEFPISVQHSWREAKSFQFDKEDYEHSTWLEETATKLAQTLAKTIGTNLTKRPDVLALALEKINSRLPEALVREWQELAEKVSEENSD